MHHLLFIVAAVSGGFEDLKALDNRISAVAPQAEQIDKRLKLAQCPDAPIVVPPAGGAVIVRCPAVGCRLRVPVKASLNQAAISEIVIHKGEMVECVSDGQGFAVSTTMIALEDAAVGQPVRVKSLTSSTTMTAYVKTRGVVSF